MKKIIIFFIAAITIFSCSTNNDSNNSTTAVIPLAPTSLTGSITNSTQVTINWTDNSTNETGFKIERKTGSGAYTLVGTVNSNVLTFVDNNLTPGTTYFYRVCSYNSVGNSVNFTIEVNFTIIAITKITSVTIGSQIWTDKNLDVTTFRDGTPILQVTGPADLAGSPTPAWCYFNNDPVNNAVYGKLYNFYAVISPRGLAPIGYHIPTYAEWTTLINYLGGTLYSANAGGKMKETGTSHWASPNTGATNSSGFRALPYGPTNPFNGFWWSSTSYGDTKNCWGFQLSSDNGGLMLDYFNAKNCFSVRCIKD